MPKDSQKDWEKEFDDRFGMYSNYADFCPFSETYKFFIKNLLTQALQEERDTQYSIGFKEGAKEGFKFGQTDLREELRGKIEGMKRKEPKDRQVKISSDMENNEDALIGTRDVGYNFALSDILHLLEDNKK